MSDIFVSYKSEDRPRAKIIAEALEQQGYSVWWDRIIPPGKTFDQVIEEALNSTKCIIVLWSNESITSDWVKNEAREGTRRHILVPALIDNVKIPFEFSHIQAANLMDWHGVSQNLEFELLLKSIGEILAKPPVVKMEDKKPSINELNLSAQQLYEEGKYSEAIDKWNVALNLYPQNKIAIEGINKEKLRREEESRDIQRKEKENRLKEPPSEIAPKMKWGSMIASLILILFYMLYFFISSYHNYTKSPDYYSILFLSHTLLLFLGFPTTIYLMYKERTTKIKYGLAWIIFPILYQVIVHLDSNLTWLAVFIMLIIPAFVIDFIYVNETR